MRGRDWETTKVTCSRPLAAAVLAELRILAKLLEAPMSHNAASNLSAAQRRRPHKAAPPFAAAIDATGERLTRLYNLAREKAATTRSSSRKQE